MKYIVMEIQTNTDGTVGTIVNSYDKKDEAESKYHTILASAAISSLPTHSAIMFTNDSMLIKSEFYTHEEETNE